MSKKSLDAKTGGDLYTKESVKNKSPILTAQCIGFYGRSEIAQWKCNVCHRHWQSGSSEDIKIGDFDYCECQK